MFLGVLWENSFLFFQFLEAFTGILWLVVPFLHLQSKQQSISVVSVTISFSLTTVRKIYLLLKAHLISLDPSRWSRITFLSSQGSELLSHLPSPFCYIKWHLHRFHGLGRRCLWGPLFCLPVGVLKYVGIMLVSLNLFDHKKIFSHIFQNRF